MATTVVMQISKPLMYKVAQNILNRMNKYVTQAQDPLLTAPGSIILSQSPTATSNVMLGADAPKVSAPILEITYEIQFFDLKPSKVVDVSKFPLCQFGGTWMSYVDKRWPSPFNVDNAVPNSTWSNEIDMTYTQNLTATNYVNTMTFTAKNVDWNGHIYFKLRIPDTIDTGPVYKSLIYSFAANTKINGTSATAAAVLTTTNYWVLYELPIKFTAGTPMTLVYSPPIDPSWNSLSSFQGFTEI